VFVEGHSITFELFGVPRHGGRLPFFPTQPGWISGVYQTGVTSVTATINNDTGEVTTTYPDGSTKTITAEESAQALRARLNEASPEQIAGLQASMEERISKEQVCPYVVGLVGAGHTAAWGKVLALAAVNPVIAGLALAGETVFWTWVSTHC
ncbi:hypothetical protein ACL1C9_12870, partial [Corynebacterium striatum]